jgi:hypothetical protein
MKKIELIAKAIAKAITEYFSDPGWRSFSVK